MPPGGSSRRRPAFVAATGLVAFITALIFLDVAITLRSREFRRAVVQRLGSRLSAELRVRATRFETARGLVLEGLEIKPHGGAAPSLEGLDLDLAVKPRYLALLSGRFEIAEVAVDRLRARVARDPRSGEYNFNGLLLPPERSDSPLGPFIVNVRNAAVSLADRALLAEGRRAEVSGIEIAVEGTGAATIRATGRATSDTAGPLAFVAEIDSETGAFSGTLLARDAPIGPDLEALLAEPIREVLRRAGASGRASAKLEVAGRPPGDVSLDATLELRGVSLRPDAMNWPLEDARGTILYRGGRVLVSGFSASHGPTSIEVDGEISLPDAGPPEARLDARVRSLSLDEELRAALPPEGKEAFEILRPSGRVDLDVRIDGSLSGGEPPAIRFRIELHEASLTYVGTYHAKEGRRLGFPYPMSRVNGTVRNDGAETVLSLRGLAGHAPFTLEGRLTDDPLDPGVEIVVDAKGVTLDETLRDALGENGRETWDEFRPTGIADIRCRIFQDPGGKTNTDARVVLRGAAAEFAKFPYPVSGLTGDIRIVNDDVFVAGVTGRSGETEVKADGRFFGSGISAAHQVEVRATDVEIDADLVRAVRTERPDIADRIESLGASGTADVGYREVKGAFEDVESTIEVRLKGARVRPRGASLLVRDVRGDVTLTEEAVDFSRLSGAFGEDAVGAIRVDGRIDLRAESGTIDVDIEAERVPLDESLREAIGIGAAAGGAASRLAARAFDSLRPSGVIGFTGSLGGTIEAPRLGRLAIDLAGTRIAPPALPYPVETAAGEIALEPDGSFHLSDARGRFGLATIERLAASGKTTEAGTDISLDLGLFGLPIEPAWIAVATGLPLADIDAMKPGGRLDIDRLHLEAAFRDGALVVSGRGRVELADARLDAGLALTAIRGHVDVEEFRRDPGGYLVRGRFGSVSADLLRTRIEGFGGTLESVPHYVRLEEIVGSLYGGAVDPAATRIVLHTSAPADYAGRVVVRGLELARLGAAFSPKQPEIGGRADLDLEFRKGVGRGAGSIIARGQLDVKEGRLIDVPFVAAIVKVLAPPVAPKYTTALARFRMRRSKIVIDELRFGGAPISLEGAGDFDLDGTIDLVLVMGLPRILAIPLIDDIVRLLSQSLVAIRVAGPFDNPRVFVENVVTEGIRGDPGPVRRPKGLAFETRRRPSEW